MDCLLALPVWLAFQRYRTKPVFVGMPLPIHPWCCLVVGLAIVSLPASAKIDEAGYVKVSLMANRELLLHLVQLPLFSS